MLNTGRWGVFSLKGQQKRLKCSYCYHLYLPPMNQIHLSIWTESGGKQQKHRAQGATLKICVLVLICEQHHPQPKCCLEFLAASEWLVYFMVKWGISCVARCEGLFLGPRETSQTRVNAVHGPQIWSSTFVEICQWEEATQHIYCFIVLLHYSYLLKLLTLFWSLHSGFKVYGLHIAHMRWSKQRLVCLSWLNSHRLFTAIVYN